MTGGGEASKWDALPQSQSRVTGDLRPPGPPIPSHPSPPPVGTEVFLLALL